MMSAQSLLLRTIRKKYFLKRTINRVTPHENA